MASADLVVNKVARVIQSAEYAEASGPRDRARLVLGVLPWGIRRDAVRAARNDEIWRAFNGRNHRALAARHGLSVRQVRRIVDSR